MGSQRGFALVLTLLVTTLLVALVVEFMGDMYVGAVSHRNHLAAQQASIMADSGAQVAAVLLQMEVSSLQQTSLADRWASPVKLADPQGLLEVTITEESGRLNVNSLVQPNGTFNEAYYPIALRLLRQLKLSPDLLEALADWIDTDSEPHAGGGEALWYATARPPLTPKNEPLTTLEELSLVRGFDAAAMAKLAPCLTVYSAVAAAPTTAININTAPSEILEALDERMTKDLVERILIYRKEEPFAQPADLGKVPGMETIAIGLLGKITVKGSVYRIVSRATVGASVRLVESVVRIGSAAPSLLYWREY